MFILFGMPRSGTTLLAATLHQHDQIVVPDETDFIVPTAFIVDRIKDPEIGRPMISTLITRSARFAFSLGHYLDVKDVEHAVCGADYNAPAIVESIYCAVARKAHKEIAGDKSPNDLNFVRILLKTGLATSDIKVIHLVRDIRDVMMSLKNVDWAPGDVDEFLPRYWSAGNLYLRSAMQAKPTHYHLVRYEDLVANPAKHASAICSFLGVPFQEKMLDHSHRGDRYQQLDHHQNIRQPFSSNHVGAWREKMDAGCRARCEARAGEGLRAFGYECL